MIDNTSKLVVGLGNPGPEYAYTRHNIGFMIVSAVSEELDSSPFYQECNALCAKIKNSFLALPTTFMNRSGIALKCLINKFELKIDNILVIVDDLELPLAKIRLRKKGSSGGHNGLKSIMSELGTDEFKRLRFGIAKDQTSSQENLDTKEFVLSPFEDDEFTVVNEKIPVAVNMIKLFLNNNYQEMLDYNSKINSLSQD